MSGNLRVHRVTVLSLSAVGACAAFVTPVAQAAPAAYQAEVNNNNPYVYYRLQETGTLTDVNAPDSSANNRAAGIYRGDATGGQAGAGLASDTAVRFPGTTDTGLDYLRTTDTLAFGNQVFQSSYELIFKSNTVNPTGYQSVFGVFNAAVTDDPITPENETRTQNGAVAIELNSNGTGNAAAGTSRFYIRDEDGIALGGVISNGNLLDGQYHHVVFTYDVIGGADNYMKAYVDGVAVPVAHVYQGGGNSTNVPDNLPHSPATPCSARNLRGVVGNEADVTIDEAALYGNTVLTAAQVAENFAVSGIPEPGSLALAGIAGLGLLARRRRS